MPESLPAVPVQTAPRRFPWPWIVAAVAVFAAAWFGGDIPHRYRAGQAMREGRVALLASDLPKALGHFRTAALLRPTDEAVVQQYDQTQTRWVEMVEQKLAKLDATAAYVALRQLPATESLLVEPHLGRFRERVAGVEQAAREVADGLLTQAHEQAEAGAFDEAEAALKAADPLAGVAPDLAARRQEVQAARVSHAMARAEAALGEEKFDDARAALKEVAGLATTNEPYRKLAQDIEEGEARVCLRDAATAIDRQDLPAARDALARAAGLKVLAAEVQAAQADLRTRAGGFVTVDLAGALARDDAAAVAAALAKGHEFAGWDAIDAGTLLQPKDLPAFLKALDTVGLGPAAQAKFVNRVDIPLVLSRAAKLAPDEVQAYARTQLTEWSRAVREQHLPGLALCLDEEAQKYGATADAAWRQETMTQAADAAHVAVAVAPPAKDKEAPAGLDDAATAALVRALQARLKGWPKLVEHDPAKPVTVVLRGRFAGYSVYDDDYSDVSTKKVRYQSGTEQVPNLERRQLVEEHNELLERYNQVADDTQRKQDFIDQVNSNYNASAFDKSQAVDRSIEIASNRFLLNQWDRQLRDLRARGDALPRTVGQPVYADEEYEVINHTYTCSLAWQLEADLHGQEVDLTRWQAEVPFRTQEVKGNAKHGVPVRAPDPVPKAKLMPGLVKALVAKVGNVDEVVEALPEMTLQSFANFYAKEKAGALSQAEGLLALVYGWEQAGQQPEFRAGVVKYAREFLNLPAAGK